MTLIVGWVSADNKPRGKQISALYFASDSRYTWKQHGRDVVICQTDYGKKLFASSKYPEIFGFCGDVFLSKHLIEGLIALIDSGTFFNTSETLCSKVQKVTTYFEAILSEFPDRQRANCIILYGTKVGRHFHLETYDILKDNITHEGVELPNVYTVVCSDGSGKQLFSENWIYANNEKANEYNLSRGVYHCLSETIETVEKNDIGGVPQLVGIYRGLQTPTIFGIIKNGKRYIDGKEFLGDITLLDNIEWRNDNFERVNPYTLKLHEGAQAQPFVKKRVNSVKVRP